MFKFGRDKASGAGPAGPPSTVNISGVEIEVTKGDITNLAVEAIVVEANSHLYMEGGLAATLKQKGGKIIEEAAVRFAPCKVGEVVLTPAGKLRADYVIHAVTMGLSPKISEGIIRKATYRALLCGHKNKFVSIGFPVLGREAGDLPYTVVAKIMAQEVYRYIKAIGLSTLHKIVFVAYSEDVFEVFQSNIRDYLEHLLTQGPFLTVDGIVEHKGGLVLVERTNPPFGWALPGGFVDYGETLEEAVAREVKEETSLDFSEISLFKVYSQKERDPRFHTVSAVFNGKAAGALRAASDAKEAKVFGFDALPADIAFDHHQIIAEYLASRSKA